MLSLLHPEIMPHIKALPGGILIFRNPGTGRLLLTIKAPKEMTLAARTNKGFKIYVAPLPLSAGITPALITAFFDDFDEPLTIRTPVFDDDFPRDMKEMLSYDLLDIYFFDGHNREWMSYNARLQDGGSCLTDGTELKFPKYSRKTAMLILSNAERWFGLRSEQDDLRAITVTFNEALAPDDIMIMDIMPTGNDYIGGMGVSYSSLTRENPGHYQERDIAACLKRIFSGRQIALNPIRRDNGNEFVDALVFTNSHLLLVQAKDSPNTEESLNRTIERKRLTSRSQLKKALKQAAGAANYVKEHEPLDLLFGDDEVQLYVATLEPITLIVIKETFSNDGDFYVDAGRQLMEKGIKGIVLDYPAFDAFTHRLRRKDDFLAGLLAFYEIISKTGVYQDPFEFLLCYTEFDQGQTK